MKKSVTVDLGPPTSSDVVVDRLEGSGPEDAAASPESELARRAVAGDRSAQRQVFESQKAHVHRTLFRIMGSNRDMEDLIQETFIEVFRSLGRYRGESALRRWCGTIATRTAWRHLERRRQAMPISESTDVPDAQVDAGDQLDAKGAVTRLYGALERMPPKLRVTFALAALDERPLAEVAELTGVSVMAVKTRMWRARIELDRRARRDPVLAAYLHGVTTPRPEGPS